jgi:hypothetical protein
MQLHGHDADKDVRFDTPIRAVIHQHPTFCEDAHFPALFDCFNLNTIWYKRAAGLSVIQTEPLLDRGQELTEEHFFP